VTSRDARPISDVTLWGTDCVSVSARFLSPSHACSCSLSHETVHPTTHPPLRTTAASNTAHRGRRLEKPSSRGRRQRLGAQNDAKFQSEGRSVIDAMSPLRMRGGGERRRMPPPTSAPKGSSSTSSLDGQRSSLTRPRCVSDLAVGHASAERAATAFDAGQGASHNSTRTALETIAAMGSGLGGYSESRWPKRHKHQ
jgi:hypothetical protein